MSARFPFQRTGAWVIGLIGGVLGCGVSLPFLLAADLGVEPMSLPEKGETFFNKKVIPPYTYRVGHRRDPFVPLSILPSPPDSTVSHLSKAETDGKGLRILGIISGKQGYQALLQSPNGERHMVGPGTLLEHLSLTIKRITNDSVVVAQPLEGKGDSRIVETTLVLSR